MIWIKNFIDLDDKETHLVFNWRNDERVSKFMITTNISLNEHIIFIQSLQHSNTKKYFLVFKKDSPIGVISFSDIDTSSCEFGLYQNPNLKGYGQVLIDEIKKYAFNVLGVLKIKSSVLNSNEKAIKLYLKNGFNISDKDDKFKSIELSL
ncbi:UDP-4-amino-4,6-dideoxy-N-acetyl-beta-L-altrosamine N-acetyltransferase [Campylobacter pinnipediorum]|uniref:UDP-4-amino-4, 6-dideoxy-N-acetyl-beta-L-altrosamine N-acetyltransferase n=1 Tax=Campylobacter pinnipediorum subsp. pinnipediorum TaxID=1660067 RepID=A0AAX0LBU6_9BACT|nr:UDP-4-amino-4,6-dideoxy-N-acetyl-beta-L-altrosamine N-acetyltransferase [Campylobacter pinnipediorum]AQW82282.1 UDP-4-amino-4,6-dideoxy-beta-L-AltNAc o-acetyltransferase [Campylobacter pinnipediorum subsp. pinnipediorum]OPA81945.1 UDP-4-amino-4,6-dideoxy-N-acetyl-beta-L-altrosamine N-acetyltransferase [Campylobacter pinnipediorum subsp. pinnipediorum]